MPLPSSGQISFSASRSEFSQSLAPKYTMTDWTSGMYISGSSYASNLYSPVNLISAESVIPVTVSTESRFSPYLNNSMSVWYDYDHFATMSNEWATTGKDLYTHTGIGHCYPSSMIPVHLGTTNKVVYITISGSADYVYENVYAIYGKPWESNGTGSGNWQLITASGHFYPPYNGNVNLEFEWNYAYTASLGEHIYFVIYGDYCPTNV